MRQFGIDYDGPLVDDGKLHRFKARGDKARDSWYVLHAGQPAAGAFGCWKRGVSETWCAKRDQNYDDSEWKAIRAVWQKADEQRKKAEAERRNEARAEAERILESTQPADPSHAYLERKGIKPYGNLRQGADQIVVPLRDASNVIQSLQFIAPDKRYGDDGAKRDKTFLSGGQTKGAFFLISGRTELPLVICEGYATGASIHEVTGYAVACAMSAGNLKAVAEAMRNKWPDRKIIIAADNDQFTEENPGLTKATEAAKAIGASLAVPQFNDLTSKPTDFNDLHRLHGASDVVRSVETAKDDPSEAVAKPLSQFVRHTDGDPSELLKYRYLCRGGGLLLVGPTGIGKSSLAMQCAILWALARSAFGIRPARALKSLIIQAENDDGDIAEMRDGVIAGLNLTPKEKQTATESIVVAREDTRTREAFFAEVVRPLLQRHRPDLLWIDPALAYIGGESSSQQDVGGFLRNMLNPLLHDFNCGGVIVHHTNKPSSGKEKAEWTAGDFAYLGGGSAEWANWARAVLALRSLGSNSVFELRAAKRGARLGWKEADGETKAYSLNIAHAKQPGVICWNEADDSDVPQSAKPKREPTKEDILPHVPTDRTISKESLRSKVNSTGIALNKINPLIEELLDTGILHLWQERRSGTNPRKLYARFPQPERASK